MLSALKTTFSEDMKILLDAELSSLPEQAEALKSEGNFYQNLLKLMHYPEDAPPVADLLRQYHELEGTWLMISLVHWEASHNDAFLLAGPKELALSEAESRDWFALVEGFVAAEGMRLFYHDRYTWLLNCPDKPAIQAKPLNALLSRSLFPELQSLDETFYWQRFITESQMFLSQTALNKGREHPINGLWIWGAGELRNKTKEPILAKDESLLKLGQLLSEKVAVFEVETVLEDNSILLFPKLSAQGMQALTSRVEKLKVDWYWNNKAYRTKPKSFWSGIRSLVWR